MFKNLFNSNKPQPALSLAIETLQNKRDKLARIEERMSLNIASGSDWREYNTLCTELGITPKTEVYEVENEFFARA